VYRIIPDRNKIASPPNDWKILFFAFVTACWSPAAAEIWIPDTTTISTAIIPTMLAAHLYNAPMYVNIRLVPPPSPAKKTCTSWHEAEAEYSFVESFLSLIFPFLIALVSKQRPFFLRYDTH